MSIRKGRLTSTALSIAPVNFPTGCVLPFAGTTAPEGWLLCDGSVVSRTAYAGLFSAIGTAHGNGDGSTTFHIPDLRGRFVRGLDGAANRDPDKATRTAANAGGNTGNNIGSIQDDAFQGHSKGARVRTNSTGTTVASTAFESGIVGGGSASFATNRVLTDQYYTDGTYGTPRPTSESRGKNVNLNHIIKI
jgi:microcystin-dependent protein